MGMNSNSWRSMKISRKNWIALAGRTTEKSSKGKRRHRGPRKIDSKKGKLSIKMCQIVLSAKNMSEPKAYPPSLLSQAAQKCRR